MKMLYIIMITGILVACGGGGDSGPSDYWIGQLDVNDRTWGTTIKVLEFYPTKYGTEADCKAATPWKSGPYASLYSPTGTWYQDGGVVRYECWHHISS